MTSLKKTAWACCMALLAAPLVAAPAPQKLTQQQAEAIAKADYEAQQAAEEAKANKYPKFSELLAQGFEIKAAVPLQNYGTTYAYVLLQKGSEAYQCTNSGTLYVNAYACVPMMDGKQKPGW
ncbi:hypothetical protein FIV34_12295 [Luteibacter pinisoli]|uniref:DUF2790 domain-containing protein n=1 Tax=Luteibacter pinisoli TaxID=2589080 RepID=A0A4Y5Z4S7_9GAMM|nr:hypothetical protein [Luteibacter pinisoli]QDE39936.1 hypothetical protein FIV34_12295 [Luteibacter pinisoli]